MTLFAGEIVSSIDLSAGVTLRFPRIGKIRANGFGDPKAVEEAESVQSLHNLYYERQFQQQDALRDSQSQSQSQYSQEAYDDDVAENKFKSMEQITKKGGTRKRVRQELNVRAPMIEPSKSVETHLFDGTSFMILDGTYSLNSLEKKQAISEGWYETASNVNEVQDIIDFIFIHGGKISNNDPDLIIGGIDDDARVKNYKRAIERAKGGIDTSTKRDIHLLKMVQLGVVKWTFLFKTIHNLSDNGKNSNSINNSVFLTPRKHDYLVLSKHAQEGLKDIEDIYGMPLHTDSNIYEFKRALEEVNKSSDHNIVSSSKRSKRSKHVTKSNNKNHPWQSEFHDAFNDEEKVRYFSAQQQI